jgi:hypothetical protein
MNDLKNIILRKTETQEVQINIHSICIMSKKLCPINQEGL